MKPLLIIPPAPARWPALLELLRPRGQPWLSDLEQRIVQGVPGAEDAFAVMPSGGQVLSVACINKCGDVGVLNHVFTHPDHRHRGYARQLTETVLSWFDMTGGKWLFLAATAELDESLYRKFGFVPLRRAVWAPFDRLTMVRGTSGANADPYTGCAGPITIRELARADWPALFTMLQYLPGPDPRVPLEESGVTADVFALDLVNHLEQGKSCLQGAYQGGRLIGIASIATDQHGKRTYAMLIPPSGAPPELRVSAIELAHAKGYEQADFPMETLAQLSAWVTAGDAIASAPLERTPLHPPIEPPPVE